MKDKYQITASDASDVSDANVKYHWAFMGCSKIMNYLAMEQVS